MTYFKIKITSAFMYAMDNILHVFSIKNIVHFIWQFDSNLFVNIWLLQIYGGNLTYT